MIDWFYHLYWRWPFLLQFFSPFLPRLPKVLSLLFLVYLSTSRSSLFLFLASQEALHIFLSFTSHFFYFKIYFLFTKGAEFNIFILLHINFFFEKFEGGHRLHPPLIIIMKLLNKAFSKTYTFHPYLNYPQTNFNKTILI